MERNQVTGIILIILLMLGYFMYVGNKDPEQTSAKLDSTTVQLNNPKQIAPTQNLLVGNDSVVSDEYKAMYGPLAIAATGEEKEVILENDDLKLFFTTKGGKVKKALLKKFKTYDYKPLYLFDEANSHMELSAMVSGKPMNLYSLYYNSRVIETKDSTTVVFELTLPQGQYIRQTYSLHKNSYTVTYHTSCVGMENIIEDKPVILDWVQDLPKTENDNIQSRDRSTINYYTKEGGFDHLSEASKSVEEEIVNEPVLWIALKQKYFNSGFIASSSFNNAILTATPYKDTTGIKILKAKIAIDYKSIKNGSFKFYFGPTASADLKDVAEDYNKNLNLGYPIIREFNRFVVNPLFNFLKSYIASFGIIIIILGILVKVLLLPLSFKSQVSMAKMRVMKPELDELKTLYPDDMQKQQSEQMKLYTKVGINPLSGCVPVLLSMPVLLAMFSFFPNAIDLRQEGFLWAHDLSTYDAPIHLPFTIPFYGSHVSIFTLLMTLSTLALTFFNNQMTTAQGPMKSVSYIMPVVFMFVLNSFPAGLSFYYLVSNILSIAQQKLMQKFVDEDKIKKQLDENRVKNASGQATGKKSKFMQRVEDAMKAQEQIKNQGKKK
jgi:YidC/Oxa1 family membrane protein insertase